MLMPNKARAITPCPRFDNAALKAFAVLKDPDATFPSCFCPMPFPASRCFSNPGQLFAFNGRSAVAVDENHATSPLPRAFPPEYSVQLRRERKMALRHFAKHSERVPGRPSAPFGFSAPHLYFDT
jgi:hypothetical protein